MKKNPGEVEFHQAVHEVLESIEEVYGENPQFESAKVIERLIEPDRVLTFQGAVGRRPGHDPCEPGFQDPV